MSSLKVSTKLVGIIAVVVITAAIAVGWLAFRGTEQKTDGRTIEEKAQSEPAGGSAVTVAHQRAFP